MSDLPVSLTIFFVQPGRSVRHTTMVKPLFQSGPRATRSVMQQCAVALVALTVLLGLNPLGARAQSSGTTTATGQLNELTDLQGAPPSTSGRVFGRPSVFGKPPAAGVGLSITDKPAAAPPQLFLSTLVETKVENRTINQIGTEEKDRGKDQGKDNVTPRPAAAAAATSGSGKRDFEFSSFVLQSIGKALPLFGTDLLRQDPKAGEVDPVIVPANYRIGPGDELLIRAWGQIDLDVQTQVDRSGQIFLPRVGAAMVAGIPLSEVAAHLRKIIGRQYRDFELTATLGALRSVQIYTSGFTRQPGLHTVSSATTVLHALLSTGGPGPQADLRRVVVRRVGAPTLEIDLYDMLVDGRRGEDPQIAPGDVIHFEPVKGLVAIAGPVNREAIYHLRAGDKVADLLRYAGGLTTTGSTAQVRIERLEAGHRVMEQVTLDQDGLSHPVRAGDLLIVLPVTPRIDNAVSLRGNVALPLRAPWKPGMRVSDLIPDPQALVRPAALVQRNERSTLAGLTEARRDIDIVRDYPEVNWDFATIERLDPVTQAVSVLNFNLGRVLFQKDAAHDLELLSGDSVIVYALKDFEQPEAKKTRLVRIEGEVGRPGVYSVGVNETLGDALRRAGGATREAYVFGTRFTRAAARKDEEQRLRQATDRLEQDYYRHIATRSQRVVAQEDALMSGIELETVRTLMAKLRNHPAEGRVTMDLPGMEARVENLPDLTLEDGDVINIPSRPSTVTVVGAVFQEGTLLWRAGDDLSHYLERAGGLRRHADSKGVMVLRADGTMRAAKSGMWSRKLNDAVQPGDTIFVSEDVDRVSLGRSLRDWTSIFSQFGLGAAALKILGGF